VATTDPACAPFLKWPGGKRWLADLVVALLGDSNSRYVEPFLGGGAVFFSLKPRTAVLSDINDDLMATYVAVRDQPEALIRRLSRLRVIENLQGATRIGGYHVICAFNDRHQELAAHPGLDPCCLHHDMYVNAYQKWELLRCTDVDLVETHPDTCIPHRHSLTRHLGEQASPSACDIVKFHGDLNYPNQMELSESDYERRLKLSAAMDYRLRADLLGRALLFIGYSFRDWNVSYLFRLVNEQFQQLPGSPTGRRAYITVASPSRFEIDLFRARNIEVIPVGSSSQTEDIAAILDEVKE